jgi:hypothetical protein
MRSAFWTAIVTVEKVVTHPERVEASLFRSYSDRPQFWPAHDALHFRELDANTEWLSSHATTIGNQRTFTIRIDASGC